MAGCEAFINPLDLSCIFVNTLAGSPEIFMLGSFLVMAIAAAYFRMQGMTLLLFAFLFTIVVSATKMISVDYFVILLWIPIAYITFSGLSKVFKN